MEPAEIATSLETMARREMNMLGDARIALDPERRKLTLSNAAALLAAAERISPEGWNVSAEVRIVSSKTETAEGLPPDPDLPESELLPSD